MCPDRNRPSLCGGRSPRGDREGWQKARQIGWITFCLEPLRQYVLTLPFELRARLAYDGKLLGAVCRIFSDSVLGWYRRKLAERGIRGGQSGAITVIQRLQADLRLNPHLHALLLDPVELFLDPDRPLVKLRVGWTLAKKLAGFRYLMDVIPLRPELVKGTHGRLNPDPDEGPLLICSNRKGQRDSLHTTDFKRFLLDQLGV